MKKLILLFFLIVNALSGCVERNPQVNCFYSNEDTLILETTKFKGQGLFRVGASSLNLNDTTEWKKLLKWFDFQFIYPKDLENQKIGFTSIMFFPLKYYDKNGNDTIQVNIAIQENTIGIVTGSLDDKEVFILDENNNKDFSDDSVRTLKDWVWRSNNNLIKCYYRVEKKGETIVDSGWVKIGLWDGEILKSTSLHLESNFTIDNIQYKLGVVDDSPSSFSFFRPNFALLGENQVNKDTLLERDLLRLGEYVKLGDSYYEINKFYSGSGHIRLIKTENFKSKIGIQVGSIAPSFQFVSTRGDTINSSEYNNSDYLIANVSGCTPRSFDIFRDINAAIGSNLRIIGLNSGIKSDLEGVLVDVENPFNTDIYNIFRNAYSSYDCFLVGNDGRIKDKFSISHWKDYLDEYQ